MSFKWRHVLVDIETYSDVDIKKAGLYKYAQSPAFEVLLIAWAVDDGPVQIVDLTTDPGANGSGAEWQRLQDFLALWRADDVLLHAYNAAFEHYCLNIWARRHGLPERPLGDWHCTMAHGLYCGYTAGLAATGEAMGLPQDKRKMGIGATLIRRFCVPGKEKAAPLLDGMLPEEDSLTKVRRKITAEPEKWELFKTYCKQDVETEREIERRLRKWPMPAREQILWELTCEANITGVGVDMDLVDGAREIGEAEQTALTEEAKALSGLDNPKSVQQLLKWINKEVDADEITDLRKATVSELLAAGVGSDKATRMLELRQLMSKTSTKKYDALAAATCDDGRMRGMMFYYGASRTGRWAGRIVQPQNLPQNHLDSLGFARERVKARDAEMLKVCFGSLPDTLSQLIRTTFIPRPGRLYAVADYSAIEARVVAWLAGEQWVLDAFRDGKDIYCATASQMFGVPVEKHGQNSELRQKGKVAVLACIAEGESVLTDRGLIPIQDVQITDKLWDGESWVTHDGVIFKGERSVFTYDGLTATPDHLVWIEGESEPIRFDHAAARGARLLQSGNHGQALRLGEDHKPGEALEQKLESLPGADCMSGLWIDSMAIPGQPTKGNLEGLPELLTTEADPELAGSSTDGSETALRESERSELSKIRSAGDPLRVSERDGGRAVSDIEIRDPIEGTGARPDRQRRQLCAGKYPIRDAAGECGQPADHDPEPVRSEILALCGDHGPEEAEGRTDPGRDHPPCENCGRRTPEELDGHRRTARVYDIRNAGRHHRFTVSGKLVHNCGYGGGNGALINMGALKMGLKEEDLPEIVNNWRQANPSICALWRRVENAAVCCVETGAPQVVQIKVHDPERARENEERTGAKAGTYSDRFNVGVKLTFRREADPDSKQDFLTIELPTGRKLFYAHPYLAPAKNFPDRQSLHYYGVNQTSKKWAPTDTWGGKLVENITQAVARDCLAETLIELRRREMIAVFHVHDEVIVEVDSADDLQTILDVMASPISWAPGLPLKGAGFVCDYYQKD